MRVGVGMFNKPRADDLKVPVIRSLRFTSKQYVCVASKRNPLNGLRRANQGFFYDRISQVSVNKSDLIITIICLLPVERKKELHKQAQNKTHKNLNIAVGFQHPPDLSYR